MFPVATTAILQQIVGGKCPRYSKIGGEERICAPE